MGEAQGKGLAVQQLKERADELIAELEKVIEELEKKDRDLEHQLHIMEDQLHESQECKLRLELEVALGHALGVPREFGVEFMLARVRDLVKSDQKCICDLRSKL